MIWVEILKFPKKESIDPKIKAKGTKVKRNDTRFTVFLKIQKISSKIEKYIVLMKKNPNNGW